MQNDIREVVKDFKDGKLTKTAMWNLLWPRQGYDAGKLKRHVLATGIVTEQEYRDIKGPRKEPKPRPKVVSREQSEADYRKELLESTGFGHLVNNTEFFVWETMGVEF